MPSDRPRRRFEDDDDRDEPAPRRDGGGIPVAVVLLGGLALLAVLGLGAAMFLFTARAERRELEAARAEAELARGQAVAAERAAGAAVQGGPGAVEGKKPPAVAPRVLDEAAVEEVYRAFQMNPVAARQKYAAVRWQIRALVRSFSGDRDVTMTAPVLRTPFDVRFEEGEVARLQRGTTVVVEAVCDSCEVVDNAWTFSFRNGRIAR